MNKVTFGIEGMHCDGCASKIQTLLERAAGVRKASASFQDKQAQVVYESSAVSEDQLAAQIEKGGYRVTTRSGG